MKQIRLFLMLLVAVLLPTSLLAQTTTYTSTFNDMTGPRDNEGSSSVFGQLLTTEGNNWHYRCNTPFAFLISKTSVSGSFALSLNNIDASNFNAELASYFEMQGYVTKVTVRAGGNLSQIKARISGGSSLKDCEIGTLDATSGDVKDYMFTVDPSAGENSFVECNEWGSKFRFLYVTLSPNSNSGAMIIESIKIEVSKEKPVNDADDAADANGDGEIDVADIDFVIEHIGEHIDDTNKASDVNGDGEINVADVDYIIERIK